MRRVIEDLPRFIVTAEVAQQRLFMFMSPPRHR